MLFFRQSKILLFDGRGGGENKNFFFLSFGDRPSLHKLFLKKKQINNLFIQIKVCFLF
ncbi:hypothetical protein O177_01400 [Chlamydia trachomatis]|nr:hypothetical protein O177_01400 [Chlamydia trachomatis]